MEEPSTSSAMQTSGSGASGVTYEFQSLHKPFITSRKLEKSKLGPYANGHSSTTLPGVEIPDKPQNLPRPGENAGQGYVRTLEGKKKQIKGKNHEPSQRIPMGDRVLSVHPVRHELGSEVLGVRFANRVEIHVLRLRTVKNDEFFTMQKIQEIVANDEDYICAMAVGFNSNIGIGEKKLVYSFALHEKSDFYYVKDEPSSILPFHPTLSISDTNFVHCFDQHNAAIQALEFDGENGKYLASLGSDSACIIWEVETGRVHGMLMLESEGVAVRFHRSEPNKMMVAERNGWIRFYNLKTMKVISAVFATQAPLFTAEWQYADPCAVSAGVLNKVHLFRHVDRNCELFKSMESRGLNTSVKFCPSDRFLFATLSKFKHELRMFHTQMQPIWVQFGKEVEWIEWVYGKPFLMACVGENIEFYEGTAY